MNRFADFIVDRPRTIVATMALLTVVATVSASRLRIEFSPQLIYKGQDELLAFSEQHKSLFGYEDATVVVVVVANGTDDVLTQRALAWQRDISARLAAIPEVTNVTGLATLKRVRLSRTVPLVPPGQVDRFVEDSVRRKVASYELLRDALVSDDLRLTNIGVELDADTRSMDETKAVVLAIREQIRKLPPPKGYRVELTGIPALRVDIVENLLSDQKVMFPACAGLFLAVVISMFRNLRIMAYALCAVFAGVIWAFGIVAATGQPFSLLSNTVPTLLLIIGAANVVHLVARHLDELKNHTDGLSAARATMREMTVTCLLTFATTAIGFGSLMLSQSVILQQFAFQASVGLVCQYVCVITIVGAALPNVSGDRVDRTEIVTRRLIRWVGGIVSRGPRRVLGASLLIVICAGIVARDVEVNSYLYETYDKTHPTMRTISLLDEKLSGLAPLEINLAASDPDRLFDPTVFETIVTIQRELLEKDEVRYARSYVDLHLAAQRTTRVDADTIAASRVNVRRYPELLRREFFITDDDRSARILLRIRDVGSAGMNRLIDDINQRLPECFPPALGITPTVTGDSFLHARCMDRFVRDILYSLLTASIAIFVVISILFRSLRTGVICAIPNITPLAVTLAYIALRDYPLTAGTVIVFGITLGIAVDDTIHYLSRFREECRKGNSLEVAIAAAFESSGRAIVLTTVLIVSGLSVLLLSDFVPTRRFAELTAVAMTAALLGDLLLLPACLILFEKKAGEDTHQIAERTDEKKTPALDS